MTSLLEKLKKMLTPSPTPDSMEALESLGYTHREDADGVLTLESKSKNLVWPLNYTPKEKVNLRFRQQQPYRVLFAYKAGSYYVNDDNDEGYSELLSTLRRVNSAPSLLDAVVEFLRHRT